MASARTNVRPYASTFVHHSSTGIPTALSNARTGWAGALDKLDGKKAA